MQVKAHEKCMTNDWDERTIEQSEQKYEKRQQWRKEKKNGFKPEREAHKKKKKIKMPTKMLVHRIKLSI